MQCDARLTPPTPRIRRTAGARLRDALLELASERAAVLVHSEKTWASVTFAGARHRLELLFDGTLAVEAGEQFIAALPDHEFTIPGQLVAEATVVAVDNQLAAPRLQVTCEVLMLEDA